MATPISMLSAISANSDSYTLLVRVTRVWESVNKRNNQLMYTNLVLLDEEDNHMLAIVRNNQKDVYMPLLAEGGVYNISNVKVVPGPALYKSVDRDLAINFYYKTKIEKVPDTGIIPRHKFELKEFGEMPSYVADVRSFIDVIGMVVSYGQLDTRSNGAQKFDVVLTNARDEKVFVTLWEAKAKQFQKLLQGAGDVAVFTVITGLIAKKFSDRVILSSSDATNAYYNMDYAPINELRAAISQAKACPPEKLPKPVATRFVTVEDPQGEESTIKGVLETSLPEGTTVIRRTCEATIVAVLEGEGWYYNCCPRCSRKVHPTEGGFYCNHCAKEANDFKPRFRLIVRVEDDSGQTSFTLFNKEAEELVGVPVEKIISEISETSPLLPVPPMVKNIVGKRCAFNIKINAYNTKRGYEEYTVYRLSECKVAETVGTEEATKQAKDGNAAKKQKTA